MIYYVTIGMITIDTDVDELLFQNCDLDQLHKR